MTKKIGDKKVSTVKSAGELGKVQSADTVSEVKSIKGAASVGGVESVTGISKRRPTRVMSLAERDHLFAMIQEEAEKIFAGGQLSDEQKKVVTSAVKMAVDSSLVEGEEE